MTVSQSPVVLLSVLLVGAPGASSAPNQSPSIQFPERWSTASTACPFPTRGSVSRTAARGPVGYHPINECLSAVLESLRFCFQPDATGSVQRPLALSRAPHWWSEQGLPFEAAPSVPEGRVPPPQSVRLYVFDCGTIHVPDPARFRLKKEEVAATDLSVACYLVVHPKGTLIWDTGAVPDAAWKPTGGPVVVHIVLPNSQQRDVNVRNPLNAQLKEVGYSPTDGT